MEATLEQIPSTEIDTDSPSITFLNSLGDVTIIWDKADDAKVKELIAKKMKEGITFFIVAKKKFLRRRQAVKDTDQITERRVDIKDKDLNALMNANKNFQLVELENNGSFEIIRQSKNPEEVSRRQSVAMPAMAGG